MPQTPLSIPSRIPFIGKHLIVDAWRVRADLLDDPAHIRRTLEAAVGAGGASLIDLCVHQFSPHGVTATATLAESHISIHTWPEHGYLAADLFFCGSGDPERALETILESMAAREVHVRELERGVAPRSETGRGIRRAGSA